MQDFKNSNYAAVDRVKTIIEKGKPKIILQKLRARALKDSHDKIPDIAAQRRCKKASRAAENPVAKAKEEISKELKKFI